MRPERGISPEQDSSQLRTNISRDLKLRKFLKLKVISRSLKVSREDAPTIPDDAPDDAPTRLQRRPGQGLDDAPGQGSNDVPDKASTTPHTSYTRISGAPERCETAVSRRPDALKTRFHS